MTHPKLSRGSIIRIHGPIRRTDPETGQDSIPGTGVLPPVVERKHVRTVEPRLVRSLHGYPYERGPEALVQCLSVRFPPAHVDARLDCSESVIDRKGLYSGEQVAEPCGGGRS